MATTATSTTSSIAATAATATGSLETSTTTATSSIATTATAPLTISSYDSNIVGSDELYLLHVRSTSIPNKDWFLKGMVLLEDDTLLIHSLHGLFHASLNGECLSVLRKPCELIELWDQQSCVICNNSPMYSLSFCMISLWNFRTNQQSHLNNIPMHIFSMKTLRLSGQKEPFLAIGVNTGTVILLRVPSLENVYTVSVHSALKCMVISPLQEGDSFVCGFYCGSIVRWSTRSTVDDDKNEAGSHSQNEKPSGPFKMQLFEGHDKQINQVIQLRSDSRKLLSCAGLYSDCSTRIWDIQTGSCLCVIISNTTREPFELGSTGLIVAGFSCIEDLEHERRRSPVGRYQGHQV